MKTEVVLLLFFSGYLYSAIKANAYTPLLSVAFFSFSVYSCNMDEFFFSLIGCINIIIK